MYRCEVGRRECPEGMCKGDISKCPYTQKQQPSADLLAEQSCENCGNEEEAAFCSECRINPRLTNNWEPKANAQCVGRATASTDDTVVGVISGRTT